ncbi:X-ray radiation resistance-associated protein 1-like isoform X2 [Echeneis naucrates]|uniref:X-ray radiation resistance-associated protein 1-like isoform X2 n=1 Tax=Echeneis naucrates TaxID=173247 RepID=UPI001113D658|nr:X-ray radiation resistance-associated protein 1-like isoform X2 [Echeneis naucrates]
MAVALFPMLREIAIHSNPLTAQTRDPPLLTYHLKERLGITIKSKKTQEVTKPPLKVSTNPKWKVEERISKVPKKPTLMEAPCPAQTEEDKKSRDNSQFFFTQAADSSENEFDLQDDDKETGAEGKGKQDDNISSKFTHYDWMDAKPYPEAVQAIGIQTAVRMLEHTLKNLNVYRDSKPKLDSIQMPYRERKKRIQELPPLKPIQRPPERVDELIKQMRKSITIRRVSLSSALSSTGGKREDYKEAVSLLRDLKNKYKMVHKKTMEHLASLESAGNTNVIGAQPLPVKML